MGTDTTWCCLEGQAANTPNYRKVYTVNSATMKKSKAAECLFNLRNTGELRVMLSGETEDSAFSSMTFVIVS